MLSVYATTNNLRNIIIYQIHLKKPFYTTIIKHKYKKLDYIIYYFKVKNNIKKMVKKICHLN